MGASTAQAETVADEVVEAASCMPLKRLEAEITSLSGHLAAATCRWLLMIAEFDRRKGWEPWECRSCARWLSWHCGLDMRTAHDHVRVAHALETLPQIRAAFSAGEVSYSKVRAMTRAANPANEGALLAIARNGTTSQLELTVRGYRRANNPDDADERERRHQKRYFRWWHDDHGMVHFTGCLPPEDAAIVIAAITGATVEHQPVEDRSAERSWVQEIPGDTLAARHADALVAVADAALAAGPLDRSGTDRTMLNLHVGAETLVLDDHGECRIEGSCSIPPETARRLGCDATWITILDDPDGNPLYVSRATPTIPRRIRRALRRRDDGRCRFPGCTSLAHLEAHHIIHRAHGGPTHLDNLLLLCRFHHHVVHEGGYRIETDGTTFDFYRPNGKLFERQPIVADLTGPGIEAHNQQLGLDMTDQTNRSLWDGTRPSAGDLVDLVLSHDRYSRN